jgi:hypothetical protein
VVALSGVLHLSQGVIELVDERRAPDRGSNTARPAHNT